MEWVPRALEKNIDLGFEGSTEELTIRGDKVRLKMLLDNLLDNAIRYSPQGGCITTRLEKTDNIILSVEDEGQGAFPLLGRRPGGGSSEYLFVFWVV